MRQCELARRQGVAASTVGAYLTSMGDAVLSRRPHIVLRWTAAQHSDATVEHQQATAANAELIAGIADLLAGQAQLLNAVAQAIVALAEPREVNSGIRAAQPGVRGSVAETPRKEEEEGLPSPSWQRDLGDTNIRELRADARFDRLVAPLHALARERGLIPMHDPGPIAVAIAPHDDATVHRMVDDIVRQAESGGTSVRSPFGLLVSLARTAQSPTTSQCPTSSASTALWRDTHDVTPMPPTASTAPPSDGVFEMLRECEKSFDGSDVLHALDEAIAADFPAGTRRLLTPTAKRALRAQYYRRTRSVAEESSCGDGPQHEPSPASRTPCQPWS